MTTTFLKEALDTTRVSFDSLVTKAKAIEDDRVDYNVPDIPRNLWMNDDGTLSFNEYTTKGRTCHSLVATSWALSQISTRLGIPSTYVEKCIESRHPGLGAMNINTWLKDLNERKRTPGAFIRVYDNSINGILSSNYSKFDSDEILDVFADTIDVDNYHVVGSYISPERMHVRLVGNDMLNIPSLPKEDLFPAIFIDSSDVGRNALNVRFGIWKRVCTNGLCISKIGGLLYYQKHMGITSGEFQSGLRENVKGIPDLITSSCAIIARAATDKFDLKDEKVFERLVQDIRRSASITEDEAKKVIELSTTHYDASRWGIVNGLTLAAQNYELDKRLQIEAAAGRLIVA